MAKSLEEYSKGERYVQGDILTVWYLLCGESWKMFVRFEGEEKKLVGEYEIRAQAKREFRKIVRDLIILNKKDE